MSHTNRNVTIGMLKAVPAKWDVEDNWNVFETQFTRHCDNGVDVFITPECYLDGYAVTEKNWTVEKFARVAQEVETSPYIKQVRKLAQDSNTAIVFGFTELLDGYFYNCAILSGPNGDLVGKYHKTHLRTHDRRFARGDSLPVFDLSFGRVGTVICADRRWPESIRVLRLKGAEICLMPTYGSWNLDNEWWMRTRSFENQMFVCFTHPDVALITNPKGEVEAKLESNIPDVLIHNVDLEQVAVGKHLEDRRPEIYGILSDTRHWSRQDAYEAPRFVNEKIKG